VRRPVARLAPKQATDILIELSNPQKQPVSIRLSAVADASRYITRPKASAAVVLLEVVRAPADGHEILLLPRDDEFDAEKRKEIVARDDRTIVKERVSNKICVDMSVALNADDNHEGHGTSASMLVRAEFMSSPLWWHRDADVEGSRSIRCFSRPR